MKFDIVTKTQPTVVEKKPVEVWLGIDRSGDLSIYFKDTDGQDVQWAWWSTSNNEWSLEVYPE